MEMYDIDESERRAMIKGLFTDFAKYLDSNIANRSEKRSARAGENLGVAFCAPAGGCRKIRS